jgi:hypothetical protein
MPRARAASPAPAVLLPLALVAATFIVVAGLIVVAVAPPVVVYVLDWVRDTRVEGIRVAGELLGLTESQNVYTIASALPGNVPRLADPADVCTGLYQQTATSVACVPFSVENATMNFALQSVGAGAALAVNGTNHVRGLVVTGRGNSSAAVVGDDVVLTIDAGLGLCGACAAGQTIRLGANGTCYDCYTPAVANETLHLCGACSVGQTIRLGANGTCYDCYTTPSTDVITGGGGVAVEPRLNDTLVYTPMFTWMSDPLQSLTNIASYAFLSGAASVVAMPVGYPGNTGNNTVYSIETRFRAFVQVPDNGVVSTAQLVFDLSPLVPGWGVPLDAYWAAAARGECAASSPTISQTFAIHGYEDPALAGIVSFFITPLPGGLLVRCNFYIAQWFMNT